MARESDTLEGDGSPPDAAEAGTDQGKFDTGLLSDLFVNVVPIAIIVTFVLVFTLLSPGGEGGDPLLLFHGALIGGIVLVSIVAGWIIRGEDAPLEGSAAASQEHESDSD